MGIAFRVRDILFGKLEAFFSVSQHNMVDGTVPPQGACRAGRHWGTR
jgi:hypothetical protein